MHDEAAEETGSGFGTSDDEESRIEDDFIDVDAALLVLPEDVVEEIAVLATETLIDAPRGILVRIGLFLQAFDID